MWLTCNIARFCGDTTDSEYEHPLLVGADLQSDLTSHFFIHDDGHL